MGELTSEAASKPPLPPRSPGSQYFPCHFIDTSQSGEETPPDQFPRVWVHEFVKLESCLFLFPPPFYTFLVSSSPVFSIMRPSLLSPLHGGTKGQSGSLEYSEEYVDT